MRAASFRFFFFLMEIREHPKKVCIEHLDQLTAAGARYLDKAGPKEEANFCDLFIKSYFLSEPCVSWLLCFVATAQAALVTMKNNNARMQEHFSWPQKPRSVTSLQLERQGQDD